MNGVCLNHDQWYCLSWGKRQAELNELDLCMFCRMVAETDVTPPSWVNDEEDHGA